MQTIENSFMRGAYARANAGVRGKVRVCDAGLKWGKRPCTGLGSDRKANGYGGHSRGFAAHRARRGLKHHLAPQDIVNAVLFLASDTSRRMTGQARIVDGGAVTTG